jgi:archaellum component FlaC
VSLLENNPYKGIANAICTGINDIQNEIERLEAENKDLREMLAISAAGINLYHDDGELQDNSEHPPIDYLRDSAEEIRFKNVQRTKNLLCGGGK